MAPQVVQEVMDWLFGKRSKKNKFYGNTSWAIGRPGTRRERAYDRLLPEQDNTLDTITTPLGQKKKVIDFDDGSSMDDRAIKQKAPSIETKSSSDNRFTELESMDIDDSSFLEEEEVDDQSITDIRNKLSKLEYSDIDDKPPLKEEKLDKKKTPDDDDRYYVDEITGLKRILRFDDKTSKENESATKPITSGINAGKSPVGEMAPDKTSIKTTKSETPNPAVLKIVGKTPEPPKTSKIPEIPKKTIFQEINKEGDMDNTHYVARDENESDLVRQLHPNCNVIIPSDYDDALEEIKTCPLDCPYKALEYTELDQKSLRERIKQIL